MGREISDQRQANPLEQQRVQEAGSGDDQGVSAVEGGLEQGGEKRNRQERHDSGHAARDEVDRGVGKDVFTGALQEVLNAFCGGRLESGN